MKRIFLASIFMLVLITILSSYSDFSFTQEEHSFLSHDDEIENSSPAEHMEEEHSSHETQPSMAEMKDAIRSLME